MNLLRIPAEFRKFFHGTLPVLALVVISVLPLLFGGLFVWAYFDPIGNLHQMPVALVNSDQATTLDDGEELEGARRWSTGSGRATHWISNSSTLKARAPATRKETTSSASRSPRTSPSPWPASRVTTRVPRRSPSHCAAPTASSPPCLATRRPPSSPTLSDAPSAKASTRRPPGRSVYARDSTHCPRARMRWSPAPRSCPTAHRNPSLARTLADGTTRLADGSEQLVVGIGSLQDGLVSLDDGAGELALRMGEAGEEIPRRDDGQRSDAAAALGAPVQRELEGEEPVEFGKGLAPFFLSLSMWMGAVVMFMVLRPLNRRAIDSGVGPLRATLSTYVPAMLLGFMQAVQVWAVEIFAIGVDPLHPGWLLVALCGVSAAFVAVVQAINAVFGPAAGRVVALMLMALQLVSSNGIYPPEVQPRFIQWVHSWDPMRFSVDLFRAAMTGTLGPDDHRVGQALVVLAVLFVAALAVTSWSAYRQRILAAKDLHPELVL